MIFNTIAYYLFFLFPSAILFRIAPKYLRSWICSLFGIVFFVYFSLSMSEDFQKAGFVLIIIANAFLSLIYKPSILPFIFSIFFSITPLLIFKYWNFTTNLIAAPFGDNPFTWHGAFLPIGISFFTFEFIHYAVDRYKGNIEKDNLPEYLAFLFFFPTMVAGPIKRYQDFTSCLQNPSLDWVTDWNRGITRILVGLVKKFAIADFLASLTDHLNVKDILIADRWVLLIWLFSYGWKIYFDFSAYSDIAIGSGRLFGIKIPENFNWPYFRTNITSFWQNWHISLYKWLVDYVFIPIGGSRGSLLLVCRNILIVMIVSGIWHGAALHFVVWGIWHGLLLIVHKLWTTWHQQKDEKYDRQLSFSSFTGWLLTYISVNIGWAFFAMDIKTSIVFFQKLFVG